jgi:dihydropteroate synthase
MRRWLRPSQSAAGKARSLGDYADRGAAPRHAAHVGRGQDRVTGAGIPDRVKCSTRGAGYSVNVYARDVGVLRIGGQSFGPGELAVMAIVNRTPDSFYDRGATFVWEAALERVHQVVAEGADIVDVGGVKAAPGTPVDAMEEIERTASFVAAVRELYPELLISVDTWRHQVAEAVCAAGADMLNDAWGGVDPMLAEVAARNDAALVCTHAGGLEPRTRPHRTTYRDVMADVVARTVALAERAVATGMPSERIMIDPGHDFGKNTRHSLEVTRRLAEMVDTGWPVLVSLSNKDFVGETLGVPLEDRLIGTLATTSVCAWLGAVVFRVHNVRQTRQTVDIVASIRGDRPVARAVRGLA